MKNTEMEWGNRISIPLEDALKLKIKKQKYFIYKLTVGGQFYIGFTSQNPKVCVKQHITSAKNGSDDPVHAALRRYGFLYELNTLSEHSNEILALVDEIAKIEEMSPKLNSSIGGKGDTFIVKDESKENGENILVVEHNVFSPKIRKKQIKGSLE